MRTVSCFCLLALAISLSAQQPAEQSKKDDKADKTEAALPPAPPDSTTENTVTIGGQKIAYRAVAGSITVGGTDSFDSKLGLDGQPLPDAGMQSPRSQRSPKIRPPLRACSTSPTSKKMLSPPPVR